ncbi:MAG TPA: flagellar basal body-associated FliL family protein [Rhodospirillales bacterium]|jgi:flagellar FliL protein
MAEEDDAQAADAEDLEEGEAPAQPASGKKKLFIIIGGLLFLLVSAGAGLYFSGLLDGMLGGERQALGPGDIPEGKVFYKLENVTLNLNAEGRTARFLQIGLTLVLVNQADVPLVEAQVPRIVDYVSNYLREFAPEEMEGSANFYRVREGLLKRVRAAVSPIPVSDVLFNTVFVQ